MKWKILDRVSLPLAVYLREVEASGAWDDLERDIKAGPIYLSGLSVTRMPRSSWHRKVFTLLPEWSQRGKDLLSPEPADVVGAAPTPDGNGDDPDTKPPKP